MTRPWSTPAVVAVRRRSTGQGDSLPVTAALSDELRRARTGGRAADRALSLVLDRRPRISHEFADAGAECPWSATPRAPATRCGRAAPRWYRRCSRRRRRPGHRTRTGAGVPGPATRHHRRRRFSAHPAGARRAPEILGPTIGASEETPAVLRPLRAMDATALRHTRHRRQRRPLQDAVRQRIRPGHRPCSPSRPARHPGLTGKSVVSPDTATWGAAGAGRSALGATVTVSEVDPVKALEHYTPDTPSHAGRRSADADLLISRTGIQAPSASRTARAARSAAVAVAGGVDQEIASTAASSPGRFGGVSPTRRGVRVPTGTPS